MLVGQPFHAVASETAAARFMLGHACAWGQEEKREDSEDWTEDYEAFVNGTGGYGDEKEGYAHFVNGGEVVGRTEGHQSIAELRLRIEGGVGDKNHSKTFLILRTKNDWAAPNPEGGADPTPPVIKSLG